MASRMPKATDRTASDRASLVREAVRYTAPTQGILSKVPVSWVPYGELMRIHQPHGIYMIYFPHLVGLMYASAVQDVVVAPSTLGRCAAVLLIWTVFWRSAGCAWNDNIDQEFDRKTTRCRNRPIARGAVSTTNGHVFALVLTLIAFGSLRLLPSECTSVGLASLALSMIYPFGKRFTNYPQVILGSTLGSTVALSAYSVGLPALSPPYLGPTLCLSATVTLLVVFYDVVYARQDTADDLKSGVKGMAVRFRNHIEGLLAVIAVSITVLLTMTGIMIGARQYYYLFSVAGLTGGLVSLVASTHWDLLHGWAFSSGWCYALAIVSLVGGLATEYVLY